MNTTLRVAADHPCLPGHFPGQPVVPGVVLLDAVQAALASQVGEIAALSLPQVKFLQPLLPDQLAEIELNETAGGRWRFRIVCGDELIASGETVPG